MKYIRKIIETLKDEGIYRSLRAMEREEDGYVTIGGRRYLLLSSNNYLGLSYHPSVKKGAIEAVEKYGCGSGGSRLISGNFSLYPILEEKIASFKGAEKGLVFGSGYLANLGILSALCSRNDIILSDRLNHASLVDGAILSMAKVRRYPHKDLNRLEDLLKQSFGNRRVIVTDAVFSMDGDTAPIPELFALAKKYSAILVIDEAHAIGVLGREGRGILDFFNIVDRDHIVTMGTFGKAFGSYGAYVTGDPALIEFFINTARSFIFTTALPPAVLGASIAAIETVQREPDLISALLNNAAYLREGLQKLGFNTMESKTHIIPVLIGDPLKTIKVSDRLFENGLFVQGIRPPSVPKGMSRLRVTASALHTKADLDFALHIFKKAGEREGIFN